MSHCSGVSSDRFTYIIYRVVLANEDLFSVAKYQSTLDTMSSVEGIQEHPGADLVSVILFQPVLSNFYNPVAQGIATHSCHES